MRLKGFPSFLLEKICQLSRCQYSLPTHSCPKDHWGGPTALPCRKLRPDEHGALGPVTHLPLPPSHVPPSLYPTPRAIPPPPLLLNQCGPSENSSDPRCDADKEWQPPVSPAVPAWMCCQQNEMKHQPGALQRVLPSVQKAYSMHKSAQLTAQNSCREQQRTPAQKMDGNHAKARQDLLDGCGVPPVQPRTGSWWPPSLPEPS